MSEDMTQNITNSKKSFLVRIDAVYSFAQQRFEELGKFFEKFKENLPADCEAVRLHYRFTYYVLKMKAENKSACGRMINETWTALYGNEGLGEVFITEYEDEERLDIMRRFYNYYFGCGDVIRLVTEMTEQLPYLVSKNSQEILIRQNFLMACDHGNGFTLFLSSICEYYYSLVLPGCRDKLPENYLEIIYGKEDGNGYTSEDTLFEALNDEENSINLSVVGIDISYFLEKNKFDELRRFVKRLYGHQNNFVFVFRIPFLEKKAFDEIYYILSDVLFIKPLQIAPLHDAVLVDKTWSILQDKDFDLELSSIDPIIERIHQEKMDGRFYGFKTIENIANEMILRKAAFAARRMNEGEEITDADIGSQHIEGLVDKSRTRATGYQALAELIGMEDITRRIRELIAQIKVAISNDKLDRPSIHMRFTGAPGTGKTTVARIIGQIMKEEGILRKGAFFEYTGRDLVAEYVGQTAVKTASICRDSYGSVLFIDEAYSLYDGEHVTNDFGKEALTTLISEMENHRDDMLVVMAGYTDEMETLMKGNPGIRSRMPYILHFPNYTKRQLFDIYMLMVRKHFLYDPELEEHAFKYFNALSDEYLSSKEFANARFVRNLYERTWSKGALRCSLNGIKNIVLTKEDFIAASGEKEFNEKIEVKKVIGFKS